jgi:ABC-type nitrate/sulfonate/bicarbonate transport system permease component
MMNELANANRVPPLYSYIVAAGILGLLINVGLRRAERRILHWHHSQRRVVPL